MLWKMVDTLDYHTQRRTDTVYVTNLNAKTLVLLQITGRNHSLSYYRFDPFHVTMNLRHKVFCQPTKKHNYEQFISVQLKPRYFYFPVNLQ